MSAADGTRVLLIARFDQSVHAHNALRRRALERLGCEVTTLDAGRGGLIERLRGLELSERISRAADRARPHLVLVVGGETLTRQELELLRGRVEGCWVNWFPGDIRGLPVVASVAAAYDRVFAPGTDLVAHLQTLPGVQPFFLPHAADPSVHRPHRARGSFRANVVFAGLATPRREQLLSNLMEFGLAVWGEGWRKTGLKDYCRGELATAEDFVRAYAGATVAINIHHSLDPDPARDSRTCNQRLFELAAIGVPQVVDARGDLPLHFEEGAELLVYQNADELRGQVRRALEEQGYRERFSAAARRRVLKEHTYMHRLREVLRVSLGPQA